MKTQQCPHCDFVTEYPLMFANHVKYAHSNAEPVRFEPNLNTVAGVVQAQRAKRAELDELRAQLETALTALDSIRREDRIGLAADVCRQIAREALAQIRAGQKGGKQMVRKYNQDIADLTSSLMEANHQLQKVSEQAEQDRLNAQRYLKLEGLYSKGLIADFLIDAESLDSAVDALPDPNVNPERSR